MDEFDEKLFQDRSEMDLLVVMGTLLNVAPVSDILSEFDSIDVLSSCMQRY